MCRSPHGERGLKWQQTDQVQVDNRMSLPARGAWIEMAICGFPSPPCCCRSPHGERGLKCPSGVPRVKGGECRSPHGERGLKFSEYPLMYPQKVLQSLPARGAWIEIGNGTALILELYRFICLFSGAADPFMQLLFPNF